MAGVSTRLEMVTEVLDNLARSLSGLTRNQTTYADRCVVWLNRAQLWIARKESLLFDIATASTVADQKDYTFPSNVRAVFSLRLENGIDSVKLEPLMPWEFDRLSPNPSAESTTGRPSLYIPYGNTNTFELYRIPDQAYTLRIRYSYWPTTLSSSGQTSDFTYMDDVLVAKACEYGFSWLQELRDAREWRDRANRALAEALEAERDNYPDWEPVGRGFDSQGSEPLGEYYNNPFVIRDV